MTPPTKYIREGRFGPPKTWKTGSVVSTYPRPLLVFEYEPGGLEIVKEPIEWRPATGVADIPIQGLTALDLTFRAPVDMETSYVPAKNKEAFDDTVRAINVLRRSCPFKTLVIDTVTGLSDSIWMHQAVTNSAALADARKWAGNIGMKVGQLIDFCNALPCNVVFIFHTEVDKNELTGEVREQPLVFSKIRNIVGAKFSQFFYQGFHGGKPVLRWKPFNVVSGIGCRWPEFKQELLEPTFSGVYGQEPGVYK